MKPAPFALLLAALATPTAPQPAIPYFTNVRDVHVSQADRQNYLTVDEEIWNHARSDLADLRLYDGQSQVQYAISEQIGGASTGEAEAKILNLGTVAGQVEFDIDVGALTQYDRVRLGVDAKDFVVTVIVTGGNTLDPRPRTNLGTFTLYDFTREVLGSNSLLKLPPSSFRYLHVRISAGILPSQIKSVMVSNLREQRAAWTNSGRCEPTQQNGRSTVILCDLPQKVPLDRVLFAVAPIQANFRRSVSVVDANSVQVGLGEISRVRINRGDTMVNSEELAVTTTRTFTSRIALTIDNADNPPLTLTSVQPQSVEQRIYFDPQGKTSLTMYYGDEALSAPDYDYAKFFRQEESAARAELGPGTHNDAYAGRPDSRPWSERHPAALWVAMSLAIAILAALAIRGLLTAS